MDDVTDGVWLFSLAPRNQSSSTMLGADVEEAPKTTSFYDKRRRSHMIEEGLRPNEEGSSNGLKSNHHAGAPQQRRLVDDAPPKSRGLPLTQNQLKLSPSHEELKLIHP